MKIRPHSSALQLTCSPHLYFSWLSGSGLQASPPAANDDVLISDIHNMADKLDKFLGRIFKTSYIFQKVHVFIQGLPEGLEVAGLQQVSEVQNLSDGLFFLLGLVNREVTVGQAAWREPLAGSGWWSWPKGRLERTATTSGQQAGFQIIRILLDLCLHIVLQGGQVLRTVSLSNLSTFVLICSDSAVTAVAFLLRDEAEVLAGAGSSRTRKGSDLAYCLLITLFCLN